MLLATMLSLATLQSVEKAKPNGPWSIKTELTTCRMTRNFGVGAKSYAVEIHPTHTGTKVYLRILQSGLPLTNADRQAFPLVSINGDNDSGGGEGVATISFDMQPSSPADYNWFQSDEKAERSTVFTLPKDMLRPLAGGTLLSIDNIALPILAEVPPSKDAFEMLAECRQKMLSDWGIDAPLAEKATFAKLSKNPEKIFTSATLTPEIRREGRFGLVSVTLLVDAQGKPVRCRPITSPTIALGDYTCALAVGRLRLKPARDSLNQPLQSFYNFSVYWP